MNVHARWRESAMDDICVQRARELFAATAPHATGTAYVNFMPGDEAERVLRSVKSRRTAWLATRLRGLSDAELAAVDAAVEPLQELIDE